MKKDITRREDIERFLALFYGRVRQSPTLGYIFNDIARVNWEKHLPIICDFWETLLLDKQAYKGNAMLPHITLNDIYPLSLENFREWLALFEVSLTESFEGPVANKALERANSIATLMQHKLKIR